ncbi:MAG: phosphoglycolate phosphatase [Pusillimonas sp.]
MTYAAVLMDLDGTLINSIPDLADATNAMRVELGLPQLPLDVIVTYVGKGAESLVRRALSVHVDQTPDDALLAHGLALFKQHYSMVNGAKSAVYDGVLEGLAHLRDAGIPMAVVTNKPTEFTRPLLIACGLFNFFEHLVCGDTCTEKKPHPMPLLHACNLLQADPEKVVMVGDSANDALAAQAAGITMLAVPYGYNEGQDVQNLKVDGIVDTVYAAAQWVTRPKIQIGSL